MLRLSPRSWWRSATLLLVLGAASPWTARLAQAQGVPPGNPAPSQLALQQATALTQVDALTNNISSLVRSLAPAALDGALSCPVFADQTTRLTEDRCVWTRVTGQRIDQYPSDGAMGSRIDTLIYTVGGQAALAPGWLLGGSVSTGSSWAQDDSGSTGHGRILDSSMALTHTTGPWLFAGAIAAGTLSNQQDSAPAPPGAMEQQTDTSVVYAGTRLRIARDFAFGSWYVRPRTDIDLIYAHSPGLQSVTPTGFGVSVASVTRLGVVTSPMLEVGARVDLDPTTIVRPYLAVGMSVYPDHTSTIVTSFMHGDIPLGSVQQSIKSPTAIGDAEVGMQLYRVGGFEVKADYEVRAANAYLSQTVSLRGAYHF